MATAELIALISADVKRQTQTLRKHPFPEAQG
jgi:hypothetical protein